MKTRTSSELFILSVIYFFLAKLLIKVIPNIPSYEIVFFRSLISVFICYFAIQKRNISFFGTHRKDLVLRGIFGTLGMLTFFYSLQHLPLVTATALANLYPIFAIIFATIFLKEKTKTQDWLLFILAFLGVLLLKKVDTHISFKDFLIGTSVAVFSAIAMSIIRKIKLKEDPYVIVFSLSFIALPIFFPLMIWRWKTPDPLEWTILLLIGILVQIAQVYMTKAHQTSHTAASIAHYTYLDVVASAIVGFFVFHEAFTTTTLTSIMIILLSVFLLHRSHKKIPA